MKQLRIILALAISAEANLAWTQTSAPTPSTGESPYPVTTVPQLAAGSSYLQPGPAMIQPPPQIVPIYPAHSTVVPLPSQMPGSIFGPPMVAAPGVAPQAALAVPVSPLAQIAPGGVLSPHFGLPPGPEAAIGPGNPLVMPVADEELAWDQIADVVTD